MQDLQLINNSGQKEKVGTGEAESMSLINQQNLLVN